MMEKSLDLQEYMKQKKGQTICLLPVLHKAKAIYGQLTVPVQKQVAEGLGLPLSEVVASTTFYSAFNGMSDGVVDMNYVAHLPEGKSNSEWLMHHPTGYEAVRKVIKEGTDVITMLRDAKVCGKSGSGFPVAKKWELTKNTESDVKYIICNGSEGEGNTFKDLVLFFKKSQAVIEGMILCGLATDISQGYLYVRAEYEEVFQIVQKAIKEAYAAGVLGKNIFGSGKNFQLEAVLGGGAYVSGEETGLLQALEGKRSEPRLKPPYPGVCGLYGKPTIINNAESFAVAASLVLHGVDEFQRVGTENAGGSKMYTVCGCVENPGVYEVPYSTTAADLLILAGGAKTGYSIKGFQIGGGATGSFGGKDKMDIVLDYAGCRAAGLALGTASINFFAETESVPQLSLDCISFLKDQSCGMCTTCRYGLADLKEQLGILLDGQGTAETLEEIKALCIYIGQNSRCALGQASTTAVTTAYHEFGLEFENLCKKEDSYGCDQLQN